MMDLVLDSDQARVLDCSRCDPDKMFIRNCNNAFGKSKSPILVNGTVYRQCPRALVANDYEAGYLVSLYFKCKENNTYPYGISPTSMTAFCSNLFDFLDGMVGEFRRKQEKKMEAKQKKINKVNK
ncbi:MAG: hypothetical protein K0U41_01010 [Gammaproteobacteria bacterium]|nr:hypothetical protein [Gammaproteobacteria bacterium]